MVTIHAMTQISNVLKDGLIGIVFKRKKTGDVNVKREW
jgi:hypothetical protein